MTQATATRTREATGVEFGETFGLYETIAETGPVTAARLATAAGLPQARAQAWLDEQVAGDYIVRDPATGRYATWCELPRN
jgi:DNA-binding IclR family transcriptional regulator